MSDKITIVKLKLFYRLDEQIKEAVSRAVNFYHSECKRLGIVEYEEDSWNNGDIHVNWNEVEIHWNTYRRNCKVSSGVSCIPYSALADDTYKQTITKIVETKKEKQNILEENKKQVELKYKQSQLAKLKAELGEV
jgi:hypothetical protein